jgi:hypothetical protein
MYDRVKRHITIVGDTKHDSWPRKMHQQIAIDVYNCVLNLFIWVSVENG